MKEFLSKEGVSYQEKNVQLDREAANEMVKRSGQMGVPVTILANQVIVGFDQPALKRAVAQLRAQKETGGAASGAGSLKLGAKVGDADRVLPHQDQPSRKGAILGAIRPDSLAARAGLREGDVIVTLHGQPIANAQDLAKGLEAIATRQVERPGLTFWRSGVEMDTRLPVQFKPASRP